MSRLPTVGGDNDSWGNILNDFLGVEHNADGSQKALDPSKITGTAEVITNKGQANGYAPLDGTGKVPGSNLPAAGTTPDATTSSKGIVKLAGDLAGTADLPTVPGLAGKVDKSTVTTKGDVLAATGSAAIARVGVGANDQVLTADSTQAAGLKWDVATDSNAIHKGDIVQNVKDYGAIGDGTTDDKTAIQAAIDAANAAGGGIVYLPTGVYNIASSPGLNLKD
jgi:polygalacturonase